ncbi:MAG: copper-binding protein [Polyangiaceae bacterium]
MGTSAARILGTLAVVALLTTAGFACAATHGAVDEASLRGAKSYKATGTIKSFGPGRRYGNLAHDEIPGYMMPMTMSFEPKVASQLEGLAEGMRVEFVFLDTEDHRRVIESIAKK